MLNWDWVAFLYCHYLTLAYSKAKSLFTATRSLKILLGVFLTMLFFRRIVRVNLQTCHSAPCFLESYHFYYGLLGGSEGRSMVRNHPQHNHLELLLKLPIIGPVPDLLNQNLWGRIQEFTFLASSLGNSYITTKFVKYLNT